MAERAFRRVKEGISAVLLQGDKMIADVEESETMNASEIYSKRLNAKEVIFPLKWKM